MDPKTEKRNSSRYNRQIPITCGYVHQTSRMPAMAANYSQEGLLFHSSRPFVPGGLIRIQTPGMILAETAAQEAVKLPYMTVAEVRWCKPSTPSADRYDVGVRYLHFV
ncbi:MAG: PilZ domain-containing protein [Thermodesulfobacteriota bacterium]